MPIAIADSEMPAGILPSEDLKIAAARAVRMSWKGGALYTVADALMASSNKPEAARSGLDKQEAEAVTCGICLCIAVNPALLVSHTCVCASFWCKACIDKQTARGNWSCPTCRAHVSSVRPHVQHGNAIAGLQYKCPKGCVAFKGNMESLIAHLHTSHDSLDKRKFEFELLSAYSQSYQSEVDILRGQIADLRGKEEGHLKKIAQLQMRLASNPDPDSIQVAWASLSSLLHPLMQLEGAGRPAVAEGSQTSQSSRTPQSADRIFESSFGGRPDNLDREGVSGGHSGGRRPAYSRSRSPSVVIVRIKRRPRQG